jgi:TonB family protein
MNQSRINCLVCLLLIVGSTMVVSAQTQTLQPMVGSTMEDYLRHDAVKTVTPSYPEEAIAAGAQGLVIAAVRFDEKGDLIKITVLQSPHSAITEAVIQAVKEWKLGKNHKIDYGRPGHIQGELRFHFILENGTGRVEGPTDDELKTQSKLYLDSIGASGHADFDKPFRQ